MIAHSADPDPFVVLAASPRGWSAALQAHAADHGGVVVRATVLTESDARSEDGDVLVVDDITSFLTPALVRDVHEAGRTVLGVYDPDDPRGKGDLVDLGVDALVAADADVEELVATIRGLARAGVQPRTSPLDRAPAGVVALGHRIGVVGPPGGVGVTELAIEVAAVLAAHGRRTILLDADETAGALAQRLALPLHPNLLGAIDADRRGESVLAGLHPLSRRHRLAALPGMAATEDWQHVPDQALVGLGLRLASASDVVVADLGSAPAQVQGPAGPRPGHGTALAASCDDLLLVCQPTPVSIGRALGLRRRLPDRPFHVVLNRTPRDRFVVRQARAELCQGFGVAEVHVLPEDSRVGEAAWQGERVRRGPFGGQVAGLLDRLGWVRR